MEVTFSVKKVTLSVSVICVTHVSVKKVTLIEKIWLKTHPSG